MTLLYFYLALVVIGIGCTIAGYRRRDREQPFFIWEFPPNIFVARKKFRDTTGFWLNVIGGILMSVGGALAVIYWLFVA